MGFLNYDYQDQNQNWSGNSTAPAANNGDKEIRDPLRLGWTGIYVQPELGRTDGAAGLE